MYFCISCMNEIPEESKECCPYCGFSRSGYTAAEKMLQPESVFENRYYIGKAYRTDPAGTSYIALDTIMMRKIVIRRMSGGGEGETPSAQGVEPNFKLYERREKFLSSYKKAAAIDVSSLPVIYTCQASGATAYAASEYISEMTLPVFLEQTGGKTFEGAKKHLLPILVALKLLHDNGVVHGQLTPDCIRKTDKTFVLCDIAAVGSPEEENTCSPADDIKAFLLIFVSMMYGSPIMAKAEIINDEFRRKNELELPDEVMEYVYNVFNKTDDTEISADKILDVFYHSKDIAVLRPKAVPTVPQYLLDTAKDSGVTVSQLLTSLV